MTEFGSTATAPRGGVKFKYIALLALLAFGGGAAATWWVADRYDWIESAPVAEPTAPPGAMASNNVAPVTPYLPAPAQVDALQTTLQQINAEAAAASGNAARAEGLLVAFAARRAIDSGAPLGYLADQLRLRFGNSQPQAVAAILQASQAPITLPMLQSELADIDNLLLTGSSSESVWQTIKRESSELFVLRKASAPSPAPTQRMLRAHALVESGNVSGALAEVAAMPGAESAQGWRTKAIRYIQARRALDILERSAIIAPVLTAPVAAVPPPIEETVPENSAIIAE